VRLASHARRRLNCLWTRGHPLRGPTGGRPVVRTLRDHGRDVSARRRVAAVGVVLAEGAVATRSGGCITAGEDTAWRRLISGRAGEEARASRAVISTVVVAIFSFGVISVYVALTRPLSFYSGIAAILFIGGGVVVLSKVSAGLRGQPTEYRIDGPDLKLRYPSGRIVEFDLSARSTKRQLVLLIRWDGFLHARVEERAYLEEPADGSLGFFGFRQLPLTRVDPQVATDIEQAAAREGAGTVILPCEEMGRTVGEYRVFRSRAQGSSME